MPAAGDDVAAVAAALRQDFERHGAPYVLRMDRAAVHGAPEVCRVLDEYGGARPARAAAVSALLWAIGATESRARRVADALDVDTGEGIGARLERMLTAFTSAGAALPLGGNPPPTCGTRAPTSCSTERPPRAGCRERAPLARHEHRRQTYERHRNAPRNRAHAHPSWLP